MGYGDRGREKIVGNDSMAETKIKAAPFIPLSNLNLDLLNLQKKNSLRRLKYYNNTLFHRIVPGLVAQAGDPTGTGKGGSCAEG